MTAPLKLLIGLLVALAAGWLSHGPLGQGQAFIDTMEVRAKGMIELAALPGVDVNFGRDPLTREAIFTGHANDFQRNGQGEFLGLNERIMLIPGVSGVRWAEDE